MWKRFQRVGCLLWAFLFVSFVWGGELVTLPPWAFLNLKMLKLVRDLEGTETPSLLQIRTLSEKRGKVTYPRSQLSGRITRTHVH